MKQDAIQNAVDLYSYMRFSTVKQAEGNSEDRQNNPVQAYCDQNGCKLSTLSLRDPGMSAYKGKNATEGALAVFLDLVQKGEIKKGSILGVEDIDRISRQVPLKGLDLCRKIIESGIKIVTFVDQKEYTAESITADPSQLQYLLGKLVAAYEYSKRLSYRVGSAWAEKREKARTQNKPMTDNTPGWISLVNGDYVLNDHAATMTKIINMALDGKGCAVICKTFNRDNVPVMSRRKNAKSWGTRIFGALERELIYYRDKKQCQVCGSDVVWSDHEIHHVEEHHKGGKTTMENGALVHKHCHPKGVERTAEFAAKWKAKWDALKAAAVAAAPTSPPVATAP